MLNQLEFDLWADGYDQSVQLSEESNTYPFAGYKEVLGTIYRRIRERGGSSVLDIGFGTGTLTAKLYANGLSVTGIDFSARMIEIAREKMPNARLLQFDFSRGLPPELAGATFDFIVCTYAIHHLDRAGKRAFLELLLNHLNPGGEILLGDVMFRTRQDLDRCREKAGEDWDGDEVYVVVEELRQDMGREVEFVPCSHCAGGCILKGEAASAVTLSHMVAGDIENYVRWFTQDTEWTHWDCPGEVFEALSPEEERAGWTEYFESCQHIPADRLRQKFEIRCNGAHLGWISAYNQLEFYPMEAHGIGMGLVIPPEDARGHGVGTEALKQYMSYLAAFGYTHFYLETWSGNLPMVGVARKLGFREVSRKNGAYVVDGKSYDALVFLKTDEAK